MTDADRAKAAPLDDCWNRIGVWSRQQASCPELKRFVHCRNCGHYSAAGRDMLERPVVEEYRREWTTRLAQVKQPEETRANAVLLFRLGDEWLALHSRFVNEVTPMRAIHSLPHKSNDLIKGLVNIRGELKLCVSLGSLLQLEKSIGSQNAGQEIFERLIVVDKDGQNFVFPVTEVHGIHRYSDTLLQAAPATVAKAKKSFTTGILPWNRQHVGVLDHELLFYALARELQ